MMMLILQRKKKLANGQKFLVDLKATDGKRNELSQAGGMSVQGGKA